LSLNAQQGIRFAGASSLPQPDYDEHGVILGWSNDPEAKDARMSAQQDLVADISAEQVRRPPPDFVGE